MFGTISTESESFFNTFALIPYDEEEECETIGNEKILSTDEIIARLRNREDIFPSCKNRKITLTEFFIIFFALVSGTGSDGASYKTISNMYYGRSSLIGSYLPKKMIGNQKRWVSNKCTTGLYVFDKNRSRYQNATAGKGNLNRNCTSEHLSDIHSELAAIFSSVGMIISDNYNFSTLKKIRGFLFDRITRGPPFVSEMFVKMYLVSTDTLENSYLSFMLFEHLDLQISLRNYGRLLHRDRNKSSFSKQTNWSAAT